MTGRRRGAGLLAGFVAAVAAAGCGSTTSTATSGTAAPPPPATPLATAVGTTDGTWAVVAMGHLDDPSNTFWQAFDLPSATGSWTLRTPPGVADNGGLVLGGVTGRLVVGFRPSARLGFSPLAVSSDGGRSYTAGLLPEGLADVPDALATSAAGAAALSGGSVLAAPVSLATWHQVGSLTGVAASAPGRACGAVALTAVAVSTSGVAVGADCAHTGRAGVFVLSAGGVAQDGPSLPGPAGEVDVLRLVAAGPGLDALLRVGTGATTTYRAAWWSGTGPWSLGPALAAGGLVSTSVTPSDGFALLTTTADGALSGAVTDPGAPAWSHLPSPPPGTATLAVSDGRTDAIVVDAATMTDDRLAAGRWSRVQTVTVPIAYGSSA